MIDLSGVVIIVIALLFPIFIIGLVELCKSLSLVHDNQSLFLVICIGLVTGGIAYLIQGWITVHPWIVYLIGGIYAALGVSKIYDMNKQRR
jgi:hypothetical protein